MNKSIDMKFLKQIYKKVFSAELQKLNGHEDDTLIVMDYGAIIQNADISLDKALEVICNRQYTQEQVIHVRISKDLTSGWALTFDSFCIKRNLRDNKSVIIPYANVEMETMLLGTTLGIIRLADGEDIEISDIETLRNLETRQALTAFLKGMKRFFAEEEK